MTASSNDWLTGLLTCKEMGGNGLAKVESAEENTVVQELLGEPRYCHVRGGYCHVSRVSVITGGQVGWIGLQDFINEGNFAWPDGTSPTSYSNWVDSQPNNNGHGQVRCMSHFKCNVTCDVQHCVVMRDDGRWNDVICGGDKPAVCWMDLLNPNRHHWP